MKKSILLITVLLALFLTGCGDPSQPDSSPSSTAFDLDVYKSLVSDCREEINAASLILANTGAYENNYWKTLGGLSDDMVDRAFTWLSENSAETRETVDSAYNDIRAAYKEIVLNELEGTEAEEIDSAFRGLYDAYCEMYSLVTQPSGSRENFAQSLSKLIDDIGDYDENLSLFLE